VKYLPSSFISVMFPEDLHLTIAFSIKVYHPGMVTAKHPHHISQVLQNLPAIIFIFLSPPVNSHSLLISNIFHNQNSHYPTITPPFPPT
jgi:hypothetical protein